MLSTSRFFFACMKWQHAVILDSICEKGLDHISLSRLTDGTPHSSTDLPYFTLLLPFYLNKLFQVQPLSLFCLFGQKISKFKFLFSFLLGQKYSKSNFNSTKIFQDNSNFCLRRKIIPNLQKYSTSHFLSDLEKKPSFFLQTLYFCLRSLNGVH